MEPDERPAGRDELPAAIRFSARSATALLRGPERPLTQRGERPEIGACAARDSWASRSCRSAAG